VKENKEVDRMKKIHLFNYNRWENSSRKRSLLLYRRMKEWRFQKYAREERFLIKRGLELRKRIRKLKG
jgi:hypothetical protein